MVKALVIVHAFSTLVMITYSPAVSSIVSRIIPRSKEEVIELGLDELAADWIKQYNVLITHAGWLRSASSEVGLEVGRGPGRMVLLEGPSKGIDGSYTFEWTVIASGTGTVNVSFEVRSE